MHSRRYSYKKTLILMFRYLCLYSVQPWSFLNLCINHCQAGPAEQFDQNRQEWTHLRPKNPEAQYFQSSRHCYRVWLRDVAAELADGEHSSPLETVGFDISADQFPKSPAPRTKFVVWDMTTSFPEEYHSSFDVVHIRLVFPAVNAEQIKDVVKNLVELLRPGGYLQWTDAFENGIELTHRDDDGDPPCKYEEELMSRFLAEQGYSFHILGDVKNALQFLPVEDIHITDDTDAAYWRPEIRGMVTQWQARAMAFFLETILSQEGQSKEQAKMAADAYQEKAVALGKRGTIFKTLITTLVARKKREL
ncbi:hypothetical protein DSL72_007720 [Monilinia vaccinii-corymbosi]|uniref:Methyltransferase type 11 domain-containing protein n=1 Tax=Monilinia vaccinii-corymbosi TaxID=61207 RepID=A0A8A3PIP8_9HELO|nr:hypothetical protein DSL72_007720 [Monilinia vaccinii-corymbosi]